VKSDSFLVTGQVTGQYQAKDSQLASYLRYVRILKRLSLHSTLSMYPGSKILEQTYCPSWPAWGREVGKGQ